MIFTEVLVQRPEKHVSRLHFDGMVLRYIPRERQVQPGALIVFEEVGAAVYVCASH